MLPGTYTVALSCDPPGGSARVGFPLGGIDFTLDAGTSQSLTLTHAMTIVLRSVDCDGAWHFTEE